MESTFGKIVDKTVAQVAKLLKFTGIGCSLKFQGGGIVWSKLVPIIFGLIKNGVIKKTERTIGKTKEKIESVDLSDFNEIEVSLKIMPDKLHSLNCLTKTRRCSKYLLMRRRRLMKEEERSKRKRLRFSAARSLLV